MLPMTALSVISKHTWSGSTPVRSRQSTTNSRNNGSPSVCPEMLIATLRSGASWNALRDSAPERGLHHPSVHRRHEPVAFRSSHEFQRRNLGAGFVEHAQQDFHRRTDGIGAIGRDDGLVVQREAFFLERRLQLLQPLDLAACCAPALHRAPSTPPRGPRPLSSRCNRPNPQRRAAARRCRLRGRSR